MMISINVIIYSNYKLCFRARVLIISFLIYGNIKTNVVDFYINFLIP